ncbi:6-phosphogluconolactonase [Kiloniella sp.]|uniref:6-phosphogluconolactonase n=1 Tax=Kiloniella sp. TaxID=1938587 RepID=UPI003A95D448
MKIVEVKTEDVLYREVVDRTADLLKQEIKSSGRASLILSGGNTPQKYLPALFSIPLDWGKVTITLSDERWVPQEHRDSNEGMIRKCMENYPEAQKAKFISFYFGEKSPVEDANRLERLLIAEAMPFSVALLGMGADGHICSLFPGAVDDEESPKGVCIVNRDAPLHPRISLSYEVVRKLKTPILVLNSSMKVETFYDFRRSGRSTRSPALDELVENQGLIVFQLKSN